MILYLTCSDECKTSRGSFSNTVDFLPLPLLLYFWKEIFTLVHLTREPLPLMDFLFSCLQWYLYICLFLLSSSCNSDGVCDTEWVRKRRRNGQMMRELADGRGRAVMSLTSTSVFLSFAAPERLLEWHREWRQLPDDATKGSSWPHCVLHALLLLATGNCCLLPVPWGKVKTSPARHSPGQWKVVQGVASSPPGRVSVVVVAAFWDTLLREVSKNYFSF